MSDRKSRFWSLLNRARRPREEATPADSTPADSTPVEALPSGGLSAAAVPEPPAQGEQRSAEAASSDRTEPQPPAEVPAAPEADQKSSAATAIPAEPAGALAGTVAPPSSAREIGLEEELQGLRQQVARLEGALDEERKVAARLAQEVKSLADQDPLTGLVSARRFHDRLAMAIIQAQRYRQKLAVVQLGLDRFARLNQKLGRSHGDDLLRSVALALEGTLRQADTIARFGGDVFTILLPGIKRDEDVTVIADRLRLALRSPFSIGGHDLLVTASLGIAIFPDDGPDTESLLHSAMVSMRRAKEKGGDAWDVHAPQTRAIASERQARETALRRALVQGELELYWQPVVECETGTIVGVESLLRWRQTAEVESAADFVSLADVSGLAVPLGQWTLRAACVQGQKWHQAGHKDLVVAVNISARQLAHAALVKLVRRVLEETGLPPSCLELEVSESELARGPEMAIERLQELRKLGLRLALDDFGTGDSRLAHLYRYPIDTLKIDGSVVQDAATNRDHEAVITAAVALARSRRLRVVAEGVENEAQRVLLVRLQCDRMQGNLSGPPVPAADTEGLLLRQRKAVRAAGDLPARDGPRRLL
jgi:diguanylate cyclase (GGDEF)-like protein